MLLHVEAIEAIIVPHIQSAARHDGQRAADGSTRFGKFEASRFDVFLCD